MSYERRIAALPVDEQELTTTLALQELLELVIPGRAFLRRAKNDPVTQRRVDELAEYHDKIQRDLTGRKLANAKGALKDYLLEEWVGPSAIGVLPPFILWYPEQLTVRANDDCEPLVELVIPAGAKALLLDAESRVEAALYAVEEGTSDQVRQLLEKRVGVTVFHGIRVETAAKYFADINGKGVGVTPNLTVSRDFHDAWTVCAFEVFDKLGVELEKEKRQVSARSPAIITALQARTMVAAMVFGAGAVSFGAKKIPLTDPNSEEGSEVDFDRLRDAATTWLGQVIERHGAESLKDKGKVLRAVPTLVSIGAIGRGFYTGDRDEQARAHAFLADSAIDWTVGDHWSGIAGKTNAAGRFSVGSGKESTWATLRALTNVDDPGYMRIRHQEASGA